jgi:hypothetical protein
MTRDERRRRTASIKGYVKRLYPWLADDPRQVGLLLSYSSTNKFRLRYSYREMRDARQYD